MSGNRYLKISRDSLFADGIYTKALPYPLGIQDIPALVNEKRSFWSSIRDGVSMHLCHEDKIYLANFVRNATVGQEINFIDSRDAANWHIVVETANWG